MKSGRGLEKLCSVFFRQPFGPLPGSSYSGGFWRLLAAFVVLQNLKSFASLAFSVFRSDWSMFFKKWNTKCKMWKVLHHSPFPPPGQDGPSNYFNEIVASEENGLGTGKVGNASMNPTKAWFLTFHFWFAHCFKGPKSWSAYSKLLVQKT